MNRWNTQGACWVREYQEWIYWHSIRRGASVPPEAPLRVYGLLVNEGGAGHGIFINGIQSSGKSSVARRLVEATTTFRVLTGDDVVRRVPESQRLRLWKQLFAMTLKMVGEWLQTSNVIIDGAWAEKQVREAQRRFGDSGLYVVLRIDEDERQRREAKRTDRQIGLWDPSWHAMPGPDEMYDLVIDSTRSSIAECGARILTAAKEKWPDLDV